MVTPEEYPIKEGIISPIELTFALGAKDMHGHALPDIRRGTFTLTLRVQEL